MRRESARAGLGMAFSPSIGESYISQPRARHRLRAKRVPRAITCERLPARGEPSQNLSGPRGRNQQNLGAQNLQPAVAREQLTTSYARSAVAAFGLVGGNLPNLPNPSEPESRGLITMTWTQWRSVFAWNACASRRSQDRRTACRSNGGSS